MSGERVVRCDGVMLSTSHDGRDRLQRFFQLFKNDGTTAALALSMQTQLETSFVSHGFGGSTCVPFLSEQRISQLTAHLTGDEELRSKVLAAPSDQHRSILSEAGVDHHEALDAGFDGP